jgi:hypothetical protein
MKRKEKLNLLEKTLSETQRAFVDLKKEVEELRPLIAKDAEVDAEEGEQALIKDKTSVHKWLGGALINGKAYFMPATSTQILESNPTTKEDINWDIPQLLISKDSGLVLASNGKHNKRHFEALVIVGNGFLVQNQFITTWKKEPFTKFKGTLTRYKE